MKTILLPPAAVAATPRGIAALRAGRLRRLLQALMNQLCYIYSRSFRTYPDTPQSDNISRPSFAMNACNASIHSLVLSPGNYPQDNFRPPEGATFLEPCACTISAVSALPDFGPSAQLTVKHK